MDPKEVRRYFPALQKKVSGKKIIYFDSACSLLKPECVLDAVRSYYANLGSCAGGRSAHYLAEKTEELCEKVRLQVKQFINADSGFEVVWTKNATEGINIVAGCFPFKTGKKEVIVFNSEHHSNLLPFYEAERKRRITLTVLKVNRDGSIDLDKLRKAVTRKTALVACAHASNVLSVIYPVKEIALIAHAQGAKVLIDSAQYIPTHKEDIKENNIDLLVFSGHKLGGPTGIGVLAGKKDLLGRFEPYAVGGGTVESVLLDNAGALKVAYLKVPRFFEAGIQHYAGILGLGKALNFIDHLGYQTISHHVGALTAYLYGRLSEMKGVGIVGEYKSAPNGSLLSFVFTDKRLSLFDFNMFLNQGLKGHSVMVRCGHHCAQPIHQFFKIEVSMRVSFFMYNTKREVDVFLDAVRSYAHK